MPEAIAHTDRDDRFAWGDGTDELGTARRATAVMTHLEYVCAEAIRAESEEIALFLALGISDEQERAGAERDASDDRIVVGTPVRRRIGAGGENLDARPAEIPRATKVVRAKDPRVLLARVRKQRRVAAAHPFALPLPGIPERSHVHAVQTAREPREMIRMRMGENHGQRVRAPSRTQGRRDDTRPGIDRAPHETSTVDEHGLAARKIDERSVTLPHVEKSGTQDAASSRRTPDLELEQPRQGQ
jgi:hypothetical protein